MTARLYTLPFLLLFLLPAMLEAQPLLIPYYDGKLWGYSDSTGTVRIRPRWRQADLFREGKGKVQTDLRTQSGGSYAMIREDGSYLIPEEWGWDGTWQNWPNARLNMWDAAGHAGMTDDEGCVLIPPVYEGWGAFSVNESLGYPVMTVRKNGKTGIIDSQDRIIIPFEYRSLRGLPVAIDWSHHWASNIYNEYISFKEQPLLQEIVTDMRSRYLWAEKDSGSYGIIDWQNRVRVPFGRYDLVECNHPSFVQAERGAKHGLLDTSFNELLPAQYDAPVIPLSENRFLTAINGTNDMHWGVVDRNGTVLLPFHYKSIALQKGQLVVTLDSTTKADVRKEAMFQENGVLCNYFYTRRYDLATLAPSGPWTKDSTCMSFGLNSSWGCGSRDYRESYYYNWSPLVRFRDSLVREFQVDSINWYTYKKVGPGLVLVNGKKDGRQYTAIVDREAHFVWGPQPGEVNIVRYNAADRLLIVLKVHKDSNGNSAYPVYAVTDALLRPLIDYQPTSLVNCFLHNGVAYALTGAVREEDYDDNADFRHGYGDHRSRLIDSSGKEAAILSRYRDAIAYLCHEDGTPAPGFEGYFFVRDSLQREGIITFDGKTVHPALSFRYRGLKPQGHNWYLCAADGSYSWTDGEGKEYKPGLKVHDIRRVWQEGIGRYEPGLYRIDATDPSGNRNQLFLTTNSVVHTSLY